MSEKPCLIKVSGITSMMLTVLLTTKFLAAQPNNNTGSAIFAPDPQLEDRFGFTVAVSGNHVIIGAFNDDTDANGENFMENAGAVYVLNKDEEGDWILTQKVVAPDRAPGDHFGTSVAVDGNYAVVGAESKTYDPGIGEDSVAKAGRAYIYRLIQEMLNNDWEYQGQLFPNQPAENALFGYSVGIKFPSILIGAPGEGFDANGENFLPGAGAVYGFEFINGAFQQNQKIVAFDREANDLFGISLDLTNIFAVVGAPYDGSDENGENNVLQAGSVYFYNRELADELLAEAGWFENADGLRKVVNSHGRNPQDYYGWSVSAGDNSFFVGIPGMDTDLEGGNFMEDAGAAELFYGIEHALLPEFRTGLISADRNPYTYYGYAVELGDPTPHFPNTHLFIGSIGDKWDVAGGNEIFDAGSIEMNAFATINGNSAMKQGSGVNMMAAEFDVQFLQKIVPADRSVGDNFGASIAVSGNDLVVGAVRKNFIEGEDTITNAGAAYIMELCSTSRSNVSVTSCSSYQSASGNYLWTESGNYRDTVLNSIGCDSIITTQLVIDPIDNSVRVNAGSLEANEVDATYQWLDYENNYQPINGAIQKTFNPGGSGIYAVQISKGNCLDTSGYYAINITGTPEWQPGEEMVLYPNPGTDKFRIDLGEIRKEARIEIFDQSGKHVSGATHRNRQTIDFVIEGPKGVYNVLIYSDQNQPIHKQAIKQ